MFVNVTGSAMYSPPEWKDYFLPRNSTLNLIEAENGWMIYEGFKYNAWSTHNKRWVFNSLPDVIAFGYEYEREKETKKMEAIKHILTTGTLPTTANCVTTLGPLTNITSVGGFPISSGSPISISDGATISYDPFTTERITNPLMNIEKVENGFIVSKDYKRFVFESVEAALKFIGESLATQK